jgi:ribosome-binding factor A
MATFRQRRVAESIHRELSVLLMREVRDPRLVDVTVTGVDVTPDFSRARIHFTVLGGADEQNDALRGLEHASGFLRTQLASRIRLRTMPELVFELDRSAEYGRRIDELLDQLQGHEPPLDEQAHD